MNRKAIILQDLHVPFHNKIIVSKIAKLIEKEKFDELILNGDIWDCYSGSSFDKSPHRAEEMQYELDELFKVLSLLRNSNKKMKMIYILGNHSERIKKFIAKNRSLSNLRSMSFRNLLRADELNMQICSHKYTFGKYLITHGTRYGLNAARNTLINDYMGYNSIIGHGHKTTYAKITTITGKVYECLGAGHLSNKESQEYAKNRSWDSSFIIIENNQGKHIHCDNNSFYYNNVKY